MKAPLLVSIPHGGWKVAEELRDIWALTKKDAFHDGDPLTARIYDFADRVNVQLVMEYYRAVIDLNRAPDDVAPKNPDGVIKSQTIYKVNVFKPGCLPDEALIQRLLDRYYYPYHRALAEAIRRDDIRMGVDCHSMTAISPPIEEDAGAPRPLFCLGNLGDADGNPSAPHHRVTCPPEMIRFALEEFAKAFVHEDVELEIPAVATANVPFAGGYITRTVDAADTPFLQIEMSRALYLAKPHFDDETLEVDERRIRDLNAKLWRALKSIVRNL